MVLKPGQSAVIQSYPFHMNADMGGPHDFAVHLQTNDPSQPDVVVRVRSNWVP